MMSFWSHWFVNSVPGVLHSPFQVFFSLPHLDLASIEEAHPEAQAAWGAEVLLGGAVPLDTWVYYCILWNTMAYSIDDY